MSDPKRLSKRLMELVQCSRREAELYIEGGWVRVDGVVIEHPQHKVQDESVELDPDANLTRAGPVTVIAHQAGLPPDRLEIHLEAHHRWPEDTYPFQPLACHLRALQICLPLEQGMEGMQILTQDAGVTRQLMATHATIEQEFVVQVQGHLTPEQLAQLNCGLSMHGKPLRPARVSWQSETRLRFALKNPLPGQLVSMCEQVGLQIQHIKRIRVGAQPLKKMPLGQWRYQPPLIRF